MSDNPTGVDLRIATSSFGSTPGIAQSSNQIRSIDMTLQVNQSGTLTLEGCELVVAADGLRLRGVRVSEIRPEDLVYVGYLGQGRGGAVERMLHKPSDTLIAVKAIKTEQSSSGRSRRNDEVRRELRALFLAKERTGSAIAGRAHLVDLYGAWSRPGSVFIAMENMAGSLSDFSGKPMPLPVLKRVARMLLRGLQFLHDEAKILHRDVKPSNTLFDNASGAVKISDFGLATELGSTAGQARNFVGSNVYMAPERLRNEPHSFVSDVWSAGVTIAEIALGRHPFAEALAGKASEEEQFWALFGLTDDNCARARKMIEANANLDEDLKEFLLMGVLVPVADRLTCQELLDDTEFMDGIDDDGAADGLPPPRVQPSGLSTGPLPESAAGMIGDAVTAAWFQRNRPVTGGQSAQMMPSMAH